MMHRLIALLDVMWRPSPLWPVVRPRYNDLDENLRPFRNLHVYKKTHFRKKIWQDHPFPSTIQFNEKTFQLFLKTIKDVSNARLVLCCMDAVQAFRQQFGNTCQVYACSLLPTAPTSPLVFSARPMPVLFVHATNTTGRKLLAAWYRSALDALIRKNLYLHKLHPESDHYCCSIEQLDLNSIKTTLDPTTRVCGNIDCKKQGVTLVCSRCKLERFCDRECFKKSWKAHKAHCTPADTKNNVTTQNV
jgi:hypothetical protein